MSIYGDGFRQSDANSSISLSNISSGNGTNGRNIKRMELVYGDTSIKFAINPEDYTQKEPNRATLTQTKGGAWIDAWGAGIVEFTLKGITGVSGRKVSSSSLNSNNAEAGRHSIDIGYQRWKEMRDLFRKVFDAVQDGEEVTELIKFYNYTDNEYWYCYPTQSGIELYRSKSRPHVYQYTINLWGLRKLGEPNKEDGVIGNPNKENIESFLSEDELSDVLTIKDSTSTVSGGNVYTTKNVALNTHADITTKTFTKSKAISIMRQQCHNYAIEMSGIIGGYNGKIVPATAYYCSDSLQVGDSGTVVNVRPFRGSSFESDDKISKFLMREVFFDNKVSISSFELWKSIKSYSDKVLSSEFSYIVGSTPKERIIRAIAFNNSFNSTVYEYVLKYKVKYYINRSEELMLKMILLESMLVYLELEHMYESQGEIKSNLTQSSMRTLISNVQAIIVHFEMTGTENNKFYVQNISAELRKLESILVQVNSDIIAYL